MGAAGSVSRQLQVGDAAKAKAKANAEVDAATATNDDADADASQEIASTPGNEKWHPAGATSVSLSGQTPTAISLCFPFYY